MSAPRHGRQRSKGHTGLKILVIVLLLVLALVCAALTWSLLTDRVLSWDALVGSFTSPSTSTTVAAPAPSSTAPSTTATTTTTGVTSGVSHYKQAKAKEWSLLLVNRWNFLPDDYEATTTYVDYDSQGNRIDDRVRTALEKMLSAGSEHGLWGLLLYRDGETQQGYFDDAVAKWKAEGYSESEAEVMAATEVIRPGTSEHQTGMAVDILGSGYTAREEAFEESDAFQWLQEHCAEYGFILRYPKGKEDITGMDYEPWHYRYVGQEYAEEIMSRGLTLEEFLEEKGW